MRSSIGIARIARGIGASDGAVHAILIAALLTALNALKPLHVDDVIWSYYARHIAAHPTAPFDFTIYWHQIPQPAQNVMAPPLLPYWWAAAIKLFGDSPPLWKLALFPINLALTFGVFALARRFASELKRPLTWLVVLSPTILPSENMMLDVPCLAFVLAGIALFLHACDRASLRHAVLACALIGLALWTKWSAFSALGVLAVAALMFAPSWRWWLLPAIPVAMFVSWEVFISATVGESHFLHHLRVDNPVRSKSDLLLPLLLIPGGVAPAVALLGAVGFKLPRPWVWGSMLAYAVGLVLIALDPLASVASVRIPLGGGSWDPRTDTPVYLVLGIACWGMTAAMGWRELNRARDTGIWARENRITLFLLAWLLIELAGYFLLSPFPAVRRVIGLVVVMTLLAGHAAGRLSGAAKQAWSIAIFQIAVALVFLSVDTLEASAARRAAEESGAWIRAQDTERTIWFTGMHGFEFYATRFGMSPMSPGHSQLEPGDWLVIETRGPAALERQIPYAFEPAKLRLERELAFGDSIPLTTVLCYYLGRRPLEHHGGARINVSIFRVSDHFAPLRRESH